MTKLLFLMFFGQDVVNVILIKRGLFAWVAPFSALKEVLVLAVLALHWLRMSPERPMSRSSVFVTLAVALLFANGILRGVLRYPLDGVLFELRTLALPLLLYFWGRAFVEQRSLARRRVEDMIGFYTNVSMVFALSAIVDYFFLGDDFWLAVDVGSVARAKGYLATTSGPLPDNMYSFFFGRRAFGLAFNPLNLAYMLIPTLLFTWYRRQWKRMALAAIPFVLSFSRVPILATVGTAMLSLLPVPLRILAMTVGALVVALLVYGFSGTVFADPSASEHLTDIALGLFQQLANPLGEGIGAAGVYAGNYSLLSLESAVLNTANQITLLGLVIYALVLVPGLRRGSPLQHEMRMMAAIFSLTAVFAPQIFVIKSTFAFFFFLGANAAMSDRSLAPGHPQEAPIGQGQPVGLGV